MSDFGKLDWELLLRGVQAMQPRWVANGNQAAGTSLSVRYANPQSLVPLVGASDQKNFLGARIVFGPGSGDVPSANMGFSTTISAITSTVSSGVTTTILTLADAILNPVNNGDQFILYPAQEVTVTAPENIAQVGGIAVPTDFAGNLVVPITQFDQLVQNGTIGATQTGFVASGDEVAYLTMTVNGTYRINGELLCQSLVVNLGGTVIVGDSGQITSGAF